MSSSINILHKLKRRVHGLKLFFQELFNHPSKMGTVFPSSPRLATAMARSIPALSPDGLVVELGGGTGAITNALRNHVPARQLIVIERSSSLANHLKQRFPNVMVLNGDALELDKLLAEKAGKVECVISGLPMLSLPVTVSQGILEALQKLNSSPKTFIQFTYNPYKAHPVDHCPAFTLRTSHKVWLNIPPAWVRIYDF